MSVGAIFAGQTNTPASATRPADTSASTPAVKADPTPVAADRVTVSDEAKHEPPAQEENWWQKNLLDPIGDTLGEGVRLESTLGGVLENGAGNLLNAGFSQVGLPDTGKAVQDFLAADADKTFQNGIDAQNFLAGPNDADPSSRQGALDATAGHDPGTVGDAVHNSIGAIQALLGNAGEEKIGDVFNSPEAKALYDQPADSEAGKKMAEMEFQYWQSVSQQNPDSFGGFLGTMFNPDARVWIQQNLFTKGH